MSLEKQKINSVPLDEKKPYGHLEPVLQFLLEHGNESRVGDGFFLDRDGWRVDLKNPIDFSLLKESFIFPSSISFSEENDSILCRNTWVEIKGP